MGGFEVEEFGYGNLEGFGDFVEIGEGDVFGFALFDALVLAERELVLLHVLLSKISLDAHLENTAAELIGKFVKGVVVNALLAHSS